VIAVLRSRWWLAALLSLAVTAGHAEGLLEDDGPPWASLSRQQQQVLAPLRDDWAYLDGNRRQKWMELAERYPGLPPDQQQRLQQRMDRWAGMTADQRSRARANYQRARELSPEDRRARWDAYQSLSPDERKALAERAREEQRGAGRGQRAADGRRAPPIEDTTPKNNLVDIPDDDDDFRSVTPGVVTGGRGATTRLLNRPAPTAPHQQTGLPKINAQPGFVDPSTLLPRRGPQGAGVQPTPHRDQPGTSDDGKRNRDKDTKK